MDGAPDVLKSIRHSHPYLRHIFAPLGECAIHLPAMDGGYAGPKLRGALETIGNGTIQIVKRSDSAVGFEVIPRPFRGLKQTTAGQWMGCRAHLRLAEPLPQTAPKTGRNPSQAPKPGYSSRTSEP